MRKIIKITALLLMLVLTMGMVCGCTTSSQDEEVKKIAKIKIGLPYTSEDAIWADMKPMIADFEMMNDAKVTIVTVPEVGTKEYTKFLEKVYDGDVDMFLSPSTPELEELIEDMKIASAKEINSKDTRFYEMQLEYHKSFSGEYNRLCYSVPFSASYQGIFVNKDVFEQAGVEIPKDWASLNAAIPALKAKGVIPFAAGFADGANYWLDEMVLVEGGASEHSATPSKGVINSWTRAVTNIKNFYDAGAFSPDVLTNPHEYAVAEFVNKQAAMIVCSSLDLAGAVDSETVTYMSFPVSPTGIKEEGSIIAQAERSFYINKKSLAKNVDDVTALSGVMVEFINTYMGSYDYYPALFAEEGMFPCISDGADAMDTALEQAAYEVIKNAPAADRSMANYLLTFEDLKSGLIDVLSGTNTIEEYLTTVSEAEIEAQAAKKAAEKEED